MKLYHFTSRIRLSSILAIGLDKGDFPLSHNESVNGISLTESASVDSTIRHSMKGTPGKMEVRLAIEIERGERLMSWKDCRSKMGMKTSWVKSLKGDPYKWWVFFGAIPPSQIVEVYDTNEGRALTADEIEAVKAEPHARGTIIAYTVIARVTFEDALRRGAA